MTPARFLRCCACVVAMLGGCDDGERSESGALAGDAEPSTLQPEAAAQDAASLGSATSRFPDAGSLQNDGFVGTSAGPDAGTSSNDAARANTDASAVDADARDAAAPVGATCDRKCLAGYLDGYLKALVAHDPMLAKFSPSLRFTENGRVAKLGEGLWTSASSLREDTRFYFIDPEMGQAAVHVVLLESASAPVIYQARIKVVAGEISELETVAVRKQGAANGFFSPDGMVPQAAFKVPIAPEKRLKREALRSAVDVYLNFLEGKRENLNFDANCARYENGVRTATGTSIASQRWSFDVQPRYLVFDEEEGLVWGMFPFSAADSALVVGEVFKVVDGKLTMIQAVMANMPAKAWD